MLLPSGSRLQRCNRTQVPGSFGLQNIMALSPRHLSDALGDKELAVKCRHSEQTQGFLEIANTTRVDAQLEHKVESNEVLAFCLKSAMRASCRWETKGLKL